jgi:sugar/nucleoside kinase (ribokinase family)
MKPDVDGAAGPRPSAPERAGHVMAFGTLALDTVETSEGSGEDVPGGSALYFSLAASLLAPVSMVGVIGEDFPPWCLEALHDRDVDTSGVRQEPGPTMRWRARYAPGFRTRETLWTDRGVAGEARPVVPAEAARAEVAFLGSTDPGLQAHVLAQMKGPTLVALDTMSHWIEERPQQLRGLVSTAQAVFLNEAEARALGGPGDLPASAESIRRLGPTWVVVKMGAEGALAFGPGGAVSVPPPAGGTVRDPTGAGDAFAGGVVGYLAGARSLHPAALETALCFGTAAASLAIERFGTLGLTDADTAELVARARRVTPLPKVGGSA